jgi:hypothetical protein
MLVPNVLVPKLSAKGSHVWSLRMLALIVRSFADLWTPLQDLVGLWTTSGVAELSPAMAAMCSTRIDSVRQTCHQV